MRNIFDHTIGPSNPPEQKLRKSHYVVVDSSLRNKTLYSKPSKYSVLLDETYKYITSVELVSSCVPTIDLVKIETGVNDTLVINNGSDVTVTISSGEYTGEELADELETKINATTLSGFTVDYDEDKFKFSFKNPGGATYKLMSSGNMSSTIGIKRDIDSESSSPYEANTKYKLGIQNCPYVMLRIGKLEHMKSMSGNNSGIRDSFALINVKRRFADETLMYENINIKNFNPVLPKLSKLDIEFIRPDNTEHDFRNKDHVLVFKITTLNGNGGFGNTL